MATYTIKAHKREVLGKQNKKIRGQGLIPIVLYGQKVDSLSLQIDKNEFVKLYKQTGTSKLVDLQVGDKEPVKTLIHDLQFDPLTDEVVHVDFYQIKEGQELTAEIKLEFVGEAPAVKEIGGIFVKNYEEVEIKCLPKDLDLIDVIKVNLKGLKEFNDAIYIKDLEVPEQIKITEDPEAMVASIMAPKEEKEEEPVVAEGEEGEEGVEGEEGEEGEAPKEGDAAAPEGAEKKEGAPAEEKK